jgi:hypothetical protein
MPKYQGREAMFGVTVRPQTLTEVDQLRGDIPRSRYVERALIMYNSYMKKEGKTTLLQGASQVSSPERHAEVLSLRRSDNYNLQEVAEAVRR